MDHESSGLGQWSEQELTELVASMLTTRTIKQQPTCLRCRTCVVLKQLLEFHCTLPPALDLKERHGNPAGRTLRGDVGMAGASAHNQGLHQEASGRCKMCKMSLQLAGKTAHAKSNKWEALLRMYVHDAMEDLLHAQTDGLDALRASTAFQAHTQRASDKLLQTVRGHRKTQQTRDDINHLGGGEC